MGRHCRDPGKSSLGIEAASAKGRSVLCGLQESKRMEWLERSSQRKRRAEESEKGKVREAGRARPCVAFSRVHGKRGEGRECTPMKIGKGGTY